MSYKLSEREYDALHIAGFSSVEELLARYFYLLKNKKELEGKVTRFADAVGSAKCQVNVSNQEFAKGGAKTITGVDIRGVKMGFSQESDSCAKDQDGQYLKVSTADAGGGNFIVIQTKRWAINADEIDLFAQMLKDVLKVADNS